MKLTAGDRKSADPKALKKCKKQLSNSHSKQPKSKKQTISGVKSISGEKMKDVKEKNVDDLPGQKHETPGERDPLRIFFETLYRELPDNEIAVVWLQPGNLEHNVSMFDRVNEMAMRKGCTTSQLALAWVHHQGSDECPIPGTTKIENFNQNIGALSVSLTPEEMAELESFASPDALKGERYAAGFSTWTDTETPPLSSFQDCWNDRIFGMYHTVSGKDGPIFISKQHIYSNDRKGREVFSWNFLN